MWPAVSFTQTPIYGKPVTLSEGDQSLVDQQVAYHSAFNFHPLALWSDLNYDANEEAEFSLDVGDDTITLNLQKSMLYPEGARMMIRGDSSPLLIDLEDEGIYRGYVDGDASQMAGFIIRKDHFFGYYEKEGDTWFISDIRKLIEDSQSDPVTTYIKYRGLTEPDITCGTPEPVLPDTIEGQTSTDRVNGEFHFEMAYDVDYDLFSKYPLPVQPGDPSREDLIESDLAEITLKVEGYYKILVPNLQFHIVDINIWTTADSQPYNGGDFTNHWTQGKDWWQNNKSCIQRDGVTLMSGRPLGVNGYVKPSSVKIMCGSLLSDPCVAFLPYSFVHNSSGNNATSLTVARELAHIFARNGHTCECNIMYDKANCPACSSISGGWDDQTADQIRNRFKPVQVCRPSGPTFPSDECLLFAPPVDQSFNLTLEADQVILTNKSVICPGEDFVASFYNTFDPNGPVQWELGPHLEFSASQPNTNKIRNITLAPNTTCCYPFDTWIRVSFNHNCFGPVVYERKIRANSSFGLEGIYVGPNGITNMLYTVNPVPSGSYDMRLENQDAIYTWVQTTGNVSTTLPYTTYAISFGMTNQSTSFFVSTPNECGTMNRTVAFVPPSGSFRIKKPKGAAVLFPNPSKDILTLDVSKVIDETENDVEYRIINGTGGRLMQTFNISASTRHQIDVSSLPSGTYFLQIVSDHVMLTEKFQKI